MRSSEVVSAREFLPSASMTYSVASFHVASVESNPVYAILLPSGDGTGEPSGPLREVSARIAPVRTSAA